MKNSNYNHLLMILLPIEYVIFMLFMLISIESPLLIKGLLLTILTTHICQIIVMLTSRYKGTTSIILKGLVVIAIITSIIGYFFLCWFFITGKLAT